MQQSADLPDIQPYESSLYNPPLTFIGEASFLGNELGEAVQYAAPVPHNATPPKDNVMSNGFFDADEPMDSILHNGDVPTVTLEEFGCEPESPMEVVAGPGIETEPVMPVIPAVPLTREKKITGLFYDARLLEHQNLFCNPADEHDYPETPQRIKCAFEELQRIGLAARCHRVASREATIDELSLVHTQTHISDISNTAEMDRADLKIVSTRYRDVYFSPSTAHAARLSCGGAIAVSEAVWNGGFRNTVALIRPPGHHAETTKAMGFCIYNNVAVAAKVLQRAHDAKRIMILDWDVHHGNGTQKVFYNDPTVLYVSIHRFDDGKYFPYLTVGGMEFTGGKGAEGRNVNVPWPGPGMTDADYLHAFHNIIMPIAYEFNPEIIVVSAGFDAADKDPLGNCHVSPAGYAHMTHQLMSLAKGKVVICLEGGYRLDAVANSIAAVTSTLLGDPPEPLDTTLKPSLSCIKVVQQVRELQSRFWRSLLPSYPMESPLVQRPIVSMSAILAGYRRYYLSETLNLEHHDIKDKDLSAFAGQIHTSKNLQSHRGFLFIFVHRSFHDARGRLDAHINTLRLDETYVHTPTNRYLEDITRGGHAVIDIDVNLGEMPEFERGHLVKEATKYAWDYLGRHCPASRIFLIGADLGAFALTNLLSTRPVLQDRTLAAIMMISKGAVPAVHVSYADRYFDISRVFTWSPNPKGRSISTRRNYGRCFSAGPQPNDDDDDDDTASSMLLDDLRVRMFAFIARRVGNEYVRQVESSKRPETRPKLKAEQPHQQHQTILPSPHKTHLVIEINSRSPVAKKRPLPSSFQSSSIPPTTHSNGGHVGSGPPLTHPPSRTHPISTLAARLEHKQQQQQQHKQQRVHAAPIVQVTTTANPPATAKRGQATVVAASSPPGLSPSESESGSGANVLWVVHSR